MWLRLLGGGIVAAALAWVAWAIADRFELAAQVRDHKSCAAAAKTADKPLDKCIADIRAQIETARRTRECDRAVSASASYAIRSACSADIKRLDARAVTAEANLSDVRQQLSLASGERDAAVSRAEARAQSTTQKRLQDDQTLDRAPRAADGRIRCDAECLRALAGS